MKKKSGKALNLTGPHSRNSLYFDIKYTNILSSAPVNAEITKKCRAVLVGKQSFSAHRSNLHANSHGRCGMGAQCIEEKDAHKFSWANLQRCMDWKPCNRGNHCTADTSWFSLTTPNLCTNIPFESFLIFLLRKDGQIFRCCRSSCFHRLPAFRSSLGRPGRLCT